MERDSNNGTNYIMSIGSDKSKGGIVCAGSWIVDLVHDIEHWPHEQDLVRIDNQYTGIGGGAANVISDLRSLGIDIPLTPVGKIGKDRYGDIALEHCRKFELTTEYMVQVDDTPTAHTHVMNVPGGSRTFFYQGGTNDTFTSEDIPIQALARTGARLFYLGYLLLLGDLDTIQANGTTHASNVLNEASAAGMQTCVDLVSTDSKEFSTVVKATLPSVDFLFVNEVEAARACGLPAPKDTSAWGKTEAMEAAKRLVQLGAKKAVIVHSPRGALYLSKDGNSYWSVPKQVPQEHIISSVGAGDAFCAGALYGIHEGLDLQQTMQLAHRVAGASLSGRTATDAIPNLSQLISS